LSAARKPVPRKDPTANQDHKRGLLFYKGIGVDKDFKKAAQWFRQAARKGHAGAQYNLGIMSYLGQGVRQDYAISANWFQKASEQDHAAAQYNLGFLYYEGKGVEKDNLQAFMWIDRSANLGDEKAIRARETLQKALPKKIFKR
jgi:TPR repeat protein